LEQPENHVLIEKAQYFYKSINLFISTFKFKKRFQKFFFSPKDNYQFTSSLFLFFSPFLSLSLSSYVCNLIWKNGKQRNPLIKKTDFSEPFAQKLFYPLLQHAHRHNKVKGLFISIIAPFILNLFRDEFLKTLPYMKCIKYALKLQHFQRMVILTQGPDPAILYENGNGEVVGYPVTKLKYEEIDDSNETDYAFVGALLSQYIQKKSITESIKC
uniref:Adenosine kinase n=1 Tax=Onchocerca flexuosa TaxID=387005 RepID=A0A183HK39_9BILA